MKLWLLFIEDLVAIRVWNYLAYCQVPGNKDVYFFNKSDDSSEIDRLQVQYVCVPQVSYNIFKLSIVPNIK